MTQMHKGFLLIGVFLYAAFVAPKIYAATPDAVKQVLQQGLPAQPAALATLTEALKKEYEARHNVVALVFTPMAYCVKRTVMRQQTILSMPQNTPKAAFSGWMKRWICRRKINAYGIYAPA